MVDWLFKLGYLSPSFSRRSHASPGLTHEVPCLALPIYLSLIISIDTAFSSCERSFSLSNLVVFLILKQKRKSLLELSWNFAPLNFQTPVHHKRSLKNCPDQCSCQQGGETVHD